MTSELVRTGHRLASIIATVSGVGFLVCFCVLVLTLIYVGQNGTPTPNAIHSFKMTSHGRTFYLTAFQWHLYVAALVTFIASGAIAALGSTVMLMLSTV